LLEPIRGLFKPFGKDAYRVLQFNKLAYVIAAPT